MKTLIVILVLIGFISCSNQKEESKSDIQKINTMTTMLGINKIYINYKEALEVAKRSNKPIFILFITKPCRWCRKLKETTFRDEEIVKRLNSDFVVLLLDKNYSEYPSKYNITAVPNLYIINKEEEIFTSIVGYHKNPHDYIKWFDYVKVELSN